MFDLSRGASYNMFLGGDQPYIEIDSNSPNKKNSCYAERFLFKRAYTVADMCLQQDNSG